MKRKTSLCLSAVHLGLSSFLSFWISGHRTVQAKTPLAVVNTPIYSHSSSPSINIPHDFLEDFLFNLSHCHLLTIIVTVPILCIHISCHWYFKPLGLSVSWLLLLQRSWFRFPNSLYPVLTQVYALNTTLSQTNNQQMHSLSKHHLLSFQNIL